MVKKLYYEKHMDIMNICDLLDLENDYVHAVLEVGECIMEQ